MQSQHTKMICKGKGRYQVFPGHRRALLGHASLHHQRYNEWILILGVIEWIDSALIANCDCNLPDLMVSTKFGQGPREF